MAGVSALDALDRAEVGEVLRDVARDAFWEWYENSPEPIPSELQTPEARAECFTRHTCWLNERAARDLGEDLITALERLGYRIARAPT